MTESMPDFEAAGLLDGLEGEAREARRELLEFLKHARRSVHVA